MRIRIPYWLFKLVFGRQLRDLEQRAALTGKASMNKDAGPIGMTISVEENADDN